MHVQFTAYRIYNMTFIKEYFRFHVQQSFKLILFELK